MTPLGNIIREEISAQGPMTISRYMALCLSDARYGYYATNMPFGAAGDFITAPEISQMFGEMIGFWLLQTWRQQGEPAPFMLAELGPGRGTLMADILRVASRDAGFLAAMDIHLVETSAKLREAQCNTLKEHDISHHDRLSELPDRPLFLIANEFFDALPIQQFVKTDIGWQERVIDYADGGFCFVLSPPEKNPLLKTRFPHLANGIIVEHGALGVKIAAEIGDRISRHGGAAMIIDYGDMAGVGDTFQAVKSHSSCDPLSDQGQCDLTSHVQFEPLENAANCGFQFCTQGVFLENMGITARAQTLASGQTGAAYDTIAQSHRRLVHPDEMGRLFKVLALRPEGMAEAIGFEP